MKKPEPWVVRTWMRSPLFGSPSSPKGSSGSATRPVRRRSLLVGKPPGWAGAPGWAEATVFTPMTEARTESTISGKFGIPGLVWAISCAPRGERTCGANAAAAAMPASMTPAARIALRVVVDARRARMLGCHIVYLRCSPLVERLVKLAGLTRAWWGGSGRDVRYRTNAHQSL